MTKVLRLALCSKYAQVDTHWEILCLVPVLLLKEDTWFQLCLCYLIKPPVQFAILMKIRHLHCNWSPFPGLTTRKRSIPPYRKNWSHQYPVTKAQAVVPNVTQKKGTLYLSLDSDLLRWRTKLKWLASVDVSLNTEAQAGELCAPNLCKLQIQAMLETSTALTTELALL